MKIAILCFWIILTRVGYYFLIQGTHDALYYMKMSNLKDISQYLGVAGLLFVYYNKQLAPKIRHIIIFSVTYCLSFACIMLYPFLGPESIKNNETFLSMFNMFWACALLVLFIYFVFESERFSVKNT
jgi:uncharacterized membrane protein SpoIIM required for sporulation